MKQTDRRRLRKTIEAWQPMLALTDWVIKVGDGQPGHGRIAEVHQKRDLRVAELRMRPDVVGQPALENLSVLHELLHLTPLFDEWDDQLRDNTLLENAQRRLLETILDDVARWILVAKGNEYPVPSVAG